MMIRNVHQVEGSIFCCSNRGRTEVHPAEQCGSGRSNMWKSEEKSFELYLFHNHIFLVPIKCKMRWVVCFKLADGVVVYDNFKVVLAVGSIITVETELWIFRKLILRFAVLRACNISTVSNIHDVWKKIVAFFSWSWITFPKRITAIDDVEDFRRVLPNG